MLIESKPWCIFLKLSGSMYNVLINIPLHQSYNFALDFWPDGLLEIEWVTCYVTFENSVLQIVLFHPSWSLVSHKTDLWRCNDILKPELCMVQCSPIKGNTLCVRYVFLATWVAKRIASDSSLQVNKLSAAVCFSNCGHRTMLHNNPALSDTDWVFSQCQHSVTKCHSSVQYYH